MKKHRRTSCIFCVFLISVLMAVLCTGCVDYSKESRETYSGTDEKEKEPVIVATSMATVVICEKLGINLAGVPESEITQVPKCYQSAEIIGNSMAPDMEAIAGLGADWILSPVSLMSDLKPKYEAIGVDYAFLNLSSVQGMYQSIRQLGVLFDCEEKAEAMIDEFVEFYDSFQKAGYGKQPTVLILMGLPGSYVVATPNSYVGSLVELAGGKNVYADEDGDFINISTEDMLEKNPDIILRTCHAMPDQVKEMFAEEFKSNDIWKHFDAVKNDRVYDLSNENFGMSATLDYVEALKELQEIFAME